MKYKIVYIKDDYKVLVTYYPHFIEWIYQRPVDNYTTKQMEILFETMHVGQKFLLDMFDTRDDYHYYHGYHILQNSLTNNIIKIKINEYDIEVEESLQNHDIYDILKSFSHNFYMIFYN